MPGVGQVPIEGLEDEENVLEIHSFGHVRRRSVAATTPFDIMKKTGHAFVPFQPKFDQCRVHFIVGTI